MNTERRDQHSAEDVAFKVATEPWEFAQIDALNYRTFVEEIPQHDRNDMYRLRDKFHVENTYVICTRGRTLLGMIAIRGKRPFSLDSKVDYLDSYLPADRRVCEIRLLALDRPHRHGGLFRGLLAETLKHCVTQGYDLAVISGTVRELKLYRHIGFVPFGPVVGPPEARYQPMYVTVEALRRNLPWIEHTARRTESTPTTATDEPTVNLLPGPVNVHADVLSAFCERTISHRSDRFVEDMQMTRSDL